jgi:hypothetical protein
MPDLGKHAADVRAIRDGAWERPGPNWENLELLVRGFGPHYSDAFSAVQRDTVRKARQDGVLKPRQEWLDLPQEQRDEVSDQVMLKHIFIDVKNLTLGDEVITPPRFRELATDPQYRDYLMGALYQAAENVTARRADQKEAAKGNSQPPSTSSYNGDSTLSS